MTDRMNDIRERAAILSEARRRARGNATTKQLVVEADAHGWFEWTGLDDIRWLLDRVTTLETALATARDGLANVTVSGGVPDYVTRNCQHYLEVTEIAALGSVPVPETAKETT